ncbi:hypothetical protein [Flavobacterium microcysteis]|jgi:hypothetical protein|uniref:Uncharacterized protein n=1 Tax=Flavobacterium microcysteis TaxID=2596891 RepID=A0A501QCW0_9FLAO|nr:hypothetical protein [Flavobacterium microcysteis]TPD69997.1 hypothetical protein FJA49_08840 [Flavobacterium microcysteis]
MDKTVLNINDFFTQLIQYDWKRFDTIEDAFEQLKQYREILNSFETLVVTEAAKENFDFDTLYTFIQSQKAIATLPFMGRLHSIVNPYRMRGQLIEIAKKIEFDTEKVKLSGLICECDLRYKYGQNPNFQDLLKIDSGSDGYYEYTVYECMKCNFKWCASIADEMSGNTKFDKWDNQFI